MEKEELVLELKKLNANRLDLIQQIAELEKRKLGLSFEIGKADEAFYSLKQEHTAALEFHKQKVSEIIESTRGQTAEADRKMKEALALEADNEKEAERLMALSERLQTQILQHEQEKEASKIEQESVFALLENRTFEVEKLCDEKTRLLSLENSKHELNLKELDFKRQEIEDLKQVKEAALKVREEAKQEQALLSEQYKILSKERDELKQKEEELSLLSINLGQREEAVKDREAEYEKRVQEAERKRVAGLVKTGGK